MSLEADVRTGSMAFRPRARIIRTLGRDLITNQVVAVQELVKNAYDADANRVTLTFEEPVSPGQGALVIRDDGEGMTWEVIRTAWMEPATASKARRLKSTKERIVTGEKGIGRFAAARVASVLELSSVSKASHRKVTARFDWGVFDDDSRYLDEIPCTWRDEPAEPHAPQGTTLRLIGLNDDWASNDGAEFLKLRAALSRLINPLERANREFSIFVEPPPRFKDLGGLITAPAILGKPHYCITGKMDDSGTIEAVYEGRDGEIEEIKEHGSYPRITIEGRKPSCGAFGFELRVWDREAKDLQTLVTTLKSTLRDIRRDLDQASGISIYRDGFRVMLPDNDDWLRLDSRRVNNPTLRLSNNQIVGVVQISRTQNPALTDQTNRQGIVDSPQLEDFKFAVKEILSKLETRRDKKRRPTIPDFPVEGMFARFDIAALRKVVLEKHPQDAALVAALDTAEKSLSKGIVQVKEVLARYRRLATLGQLIDGILHEGRTPLSTISNATGFIKRDFRDLSREAALAKLTERLDVINKQTEVLSSLFRRIAPFSGRKRGRPKETTIEEILARTVEHDRAQVNQLGVIVELPQGATPVRVDEAEMQSIFFNLVDNALYWLQKVPEGQRRLRLEVERQPDELRVIISDSGPGVDEAVRDKIFEPYFSTKPDGVGLGLALAGELAAEYDGALELLAEGPLRGATFRVILRHRIGVDDE